MRGGPGSFLVRPSDNSPGDYSLFFHINNQIQRLAGLLNNCTELFFPSNVCFSSFTSGFVSRKRASAT